MTIYELSTTIEQYFRDIDIVNTITFSKETDIDFNKSNIYPLVNIDILSYDAGENVNTFTSLITIMKQRDETPNLNPDNKRFGSNKIDNWDETSMIANIFIQKLRNNYDISLITTPNVELFSKMYTNQLDGVVFELVVEVDNNVDC